MDTVIRTQHITTREVILYKKVIGMSGSVWVYPLIANAGDDIHVSCDPRENVPGFFGFRGYGGSILTFHLEGGEILKLRGPWHSNSDAMFADTGLDLRGKHLTYTIIARDRELDEKNRCIFRDVLYGDEKPVVGDFYRGTLMAMEMSKQMGVKLAIYTESTGGSSSGFVYPDQIDVHGNRKKEDKILQI